MHLREAKKKEKGKIRTTGGKKFKGKKRVKYQRAYSSAIRSMGGEREEGVGSKKAKPGGLVARSIYGAHDVYLVFRGKAKEGLLVGRVRKLYPVFPRPFW